MLPSPVRPWRRLTTRGAAAACTLGALALTGCSGGGEVAASDPEVVSVVTSTNVYADLVRQVGGDSVTVSAVINSPAQDPHSYEASPQDRLAVQKADVVVVNGGGYDAFMTDLTTDSQTVMNAVDLSGLQGEDEHASEEPGHEGHSHEPGDFNEHVWYNLEAARQVSEGIARQLGELNPDHAATYTDNAATLGNELKSLETELASVNATGGYLATEPMPGYLLAAAGLHDETPPEFTSAVDAESDIAPGVLKETTDLITSGHVDLLAVNQQTTTGQTDRLRDAAHDAGVPVVEFSETLPDGINYQDWMQQNIQRVSAALGD